MSKSDHRPKVLSVNNQKGGIGKSSAVVHLAAAMARLGKRILVIDCDSQGSTTINMLDMVPEKTIMDVFYSVSIEKAIYPSVIPGVDIVPADWGFVNVEMDLAESMVNAKSEKDETKQRTFLKRALDSEALNEYDLIILDTPPSLGVIAINTLCAADEVLIPVKDYFSLRGVSMLTNLIVSIKETVNSKLSVCGVFLIDQNQQTNLFKSLQAEVKTQFQRLALESVIPHTIKFGECPINKTTIFDIDPDSPGAVAYTKLTEEVIERMGI